MDIPKKRILKKKDLSSFAVLCAERLVRETSSFLEEPNGLFENNIDLFERNESNKTNESNKMNDDDSINVNTGEESFNYESDEDLDSDYDDFEEYIYENIIGDEIMEDIIKNFYSIIERFRINVNLGSKRVLYNIPISFLTNCIRVGFIEINDWNRLLNIENLQRFNNNFDINDCTPIILAKRLDTNNKKLDILDGQHRLYFFKNEYSLYHQRILVDIRDCMNDIDFKIQLNKIRSMNFNPQQIIKYKLHDFMERFYLQYPKNDNNFYGTNRPKLNESKFVEVVKNSSYFLNSNTTAEEVFEKIKNINIFLEKCVKKCKDIRFIYLGSNIQNEELWFDFAKQYKFYLQFDTKFDVLQLLINAEPGENYSNYLRLMFNQHKRKIGQKKERIYNFTL